MKSTFYDHFCAGADVPDCEPYINEMLDKGIGCLLNYSAEAKVDGSSNSKLVGINPLHLQQTLDATSACSKFKLPNSTEMAEGSLKPTLLAVKLTGLIFEPALLSRATSALLNSSTYARGGDFSNGTLFPDGPELSEEDHINLQKLHTGLKRICAEGQKAGVRLLFDAEQSWYQPAIDRYVEILSEEFNRPLPNSISSPLPFAPIIYNTYQCYLVSAGSNMRAAMIKAHANGYAFGGKLVRGAYVESERKRAGSITNCCVWSTKEGTDKSYDNCSAILEEQIVKDILEGKSGNPGTGVCYASHNATSTKKVFEALQKHGLVTDLRNGTMQVDDRLRGRMTFAQLMGEYSLFLLEECNDLPCSQECLII